MKPEPLLVLTPGSHVRRMCAFFGLLVNHYFFSFQSVPVTGYQINKYFWFIPCILTLCSLSELHSSLCNLSIQHCGMPGITTPPPPPPLVFIYKAPEGRQRTRFMTDYRQICSKLNLTRVLFLQTVPIKLTTQTGHVCNHQQQLLCAWLSIY